MERYLSQIKFIGEKEQETLFKKSVAILGLGALGSVAAELLTRAGIGHLTLIDSDFVELSNLQRQSLYDESDIHKTKVAAAFEKLQKINSEVTFTLSTAHITKENVSLLKADIILDCTDNMETRFVINEYCKQNNIPWIHAAAVGSVGVVLPIMGTYCFNCVYENAKNAVTCDDEGILNTTSYATASIQVTEAMKILLNKNQHNTMLRFNLWTNAFDTIKMKQNPSCAVCNNTITHKESNGFSLMLKCKARGVYAVKPNQTTPLNLDRIKERYETVLDTPVAIVIQEQNAEVIVYNYGEIVFKKITDEVKIRKIAEKIYEVGK